MTNSYQNCCIEQFICNIGGGSCVIRHIGLPTNKTIKSIPMFHTEVCKTHQFGSSNVIACLHIIFAYVQYEILPDHLEICQIFVIRTEIYGFRSDASGRF